MNNLPPSNSYKFQLSFKGNLVEHSVDAYAVANTILATSLALNRISELKFNDELKDTLRININAFKQGSFISEFLIYLPQTIDPGLVAVLFPKVEEGYRIGKEILQTLGLVIAVRKKWMGEKPKEVRHNEDSSITITGSNNVVINIAARDLSYVQDSRLGENIKKMVGLK